MLEEAADLVEVLLSMLAAKGLGLEEVLKLGSEKRDARGGFERGIVLLGTEERPLLVVESDQLALFTAEPETDGAYRLPPGSSRLPVARQGGGLVLSLIPPMVGARSGSFGLREGEDEFVIDVAYGDATISLFIRHARGEDLTLDSGLPVESASGGPAT